MSSKTETEEQELVAKVVTYARNYMAHYDGSHDFAHVQRVLSLARTIAAAEAAASPTITYDTKVITLAALLHDVGDRKYLKPGEQSETQVQNVLLECGASPNLAEKVQIIVSAVSYSGEVKDPQRVFRVISAHPELAVVQDADRLDAIGAIGIGRTFTFGGAKGGTTTGTTAQDQGQVRLNDRARPDSGSSTREEVPAPGAGGNNNSNQQGRGRGMQQTIEHFTEKLERLEGMMKTAEGKRLARERTERLKMFRDWWEEEQSFASQGLQDVNG